MKLSTYRIRGNNDELIGVVKNNSLINLNKFFGQISLLEILKLDNWESKIQDAVNEKKYMSHDLNDIVLLSPIPNPNSLRDAYAFRQHVETSRRNRGLEMIKEFDEFPVFYFSNHNSIYGPNDDIMCMPSHFDKLDFELEIAIVIGKQGRNIKAKNASQYIAGFMIMNDLSARGLQNERDEAQSWSSQRKRFCLCVRSFFSNSR